MLGDLSVLKGYFELVFAELSRVLDDKGTYYIFCDAKSYPIFWQVLFPLCRNVRLLIWDKMISYNGYTWRHQHEFIAWGELDETERIATGDGDIIKCRGVLQKDRTHPAEKPVDVMSKLISKHPAGMLVDPFMGTGASIIASKDLNCYLIGIEIEEKYCEIAANRCRQEVMELNA